MEKMGSPQLAEAYCDRVYDKALRERVAAFLPRTRGLDSFLPGHADPGDYDIYLKLIQVAWLQLMLTRDISRRPASRSDCCH